MQRVDEWWVHCECELGVVVACVTESRSLWVTYVWLWCAAAPDECTATLVWHRWIDLPILCKADELSMSRAPLHFWASSLTNKTSWPTQTRQTTVLDVSRPTSFRKCLWQLLNKLKDARLCENVLHRTNDKERMTITADTLSTVCTSSSNKEKDERQPTTYQSTMNNQLTEMTLYGRQR